jgi:hypothetical protein
MCFYLSLWYTAPGPYNYRLGTGKNERLISEQGDIRKEADDPRTVQDCGTRDGAERCSVCSSLAEVNLTEQTDSNVPSLGSGCVHPAQPQLRFVNGKGNCLGAHWDIVLPVPAFCFTFLRPPSIINEVWVTAETEIEFNVVINLTGDVHDGA